MKSMIFLLCIFLFSPAGSQAIAQQTDSLTIATRHIPPFAMKNKSGQWQGISIELWKQIADRLGLDYRFEEMGLKEMLNAVKNRQVDAAVAALTITSEREHNMDFTHPFLSTGLGIAVPHNSSSGWLAVTQRFLSPRFLQVIAALLGILLIIGILVWLFERRRNVQFGGTPTQGIGAGLWWSAVTMTTVGYGDKAPQTLGGRAVAMVWMFASVIIISSFTAAIATALTVGELGGKVQSKDDLARARIITVADSTSSEYLQKARLNFRSADNLQDALAELADGRFDAVVYDAAILRYQVHQQFSEKLTVLPGSFTRQDYGIALPSSSNLRESINLTLLQQLQSPAWDSLLFDYLGKTD